MPRSARSRFKCDAGARNEPRIGCLKKRVNPYGACKPVCRTFARGLRADAFDLHNPILMGNEGGLSDQTAVRIANLC